MGDVRDEPDITLGFARIDKLSVLEFDHRRILPDDPGFEYRLARCQLPAADVDYPGPFLALAMRAIGDHANDVSPTHKRNIGEFVPTNDRGGLPPVQDVVHIEFDIVAYRQFPAKADVLEHACFVDTCGRKSYTRSTIATRAYDQRWGVNVTCC